MHDRINTVIIGLSIVIATALLTSGIKDYGRSLERAAFHQPNVTFPSTVQLTVRLESGSSPIRVQQVP